MTTQEFLQALRSLKESKEALTLSAKEYNKALKDLHDAHMAPLKADEDWINVPVTKGDEYLDTRLTWEQVCWAKTHDWYRKAVLTADGYVLTVCEQISGPNGGSSRLVEFTSYKRLRAWAGY